MRNTAKGLFPLLMLISIFFFISGAGINTAEGTDIDTNISGQIRSCGCDSGRILRLYSPHLDGDDVIELQESLKELGFYQGDPTGIFDQYTERVVKAFQSRYRLAVDGIVGQQTYNELAKLMDRPVSSAPTSSPQGKVRLLIDINERTLTVYDDGKPFKKFPVAVGKPSTPSPIGDWKVRWKAKNWGTGFGTRWMGLTVPWGVYGIHGTNKPGSIGSSASHGCIRMFNRDVELLYEWVSPGTPVKIIGDPFGYPPYIRTEMGRGSRGTDVVELQWALKKLGYYEGSIDGIFGYGLETAVKQYQKDQGVPITGKGNWSMYNALHMFTD